MTKFRALALWLILMWGGNAPIGVQIAGCPANIRLSRLTGAAPLSCVAPQHPNPPATATQVQLPNPVPTTRLANPTISITGLAKLAKPNQSNATATTTPTLDPTSPIKFQLIIPVFVGGVLNSQPLLMIGGKLFKQSRCGFEQYLTTPFRSITCIITAAEFASVSDGDSVNFIYGSSWAFGALNKNQLVMKEDLQLTKWAVRSKLELNLNSVTDATRLAVLNAAIQTLKATEGATYWRDIWHLEPPVGLVVFNKDIEVLTSLTNGEDIADSLDIVHIDHTLAKVALEEARAAGGTASEIAAADQEDFQGRNDEFHFQYINALTHYRNAWQHAMNAMQSVTPSPTLTPSTTVTPAVTPGQG